MRRAPAGRRPRRARRRRSGCPPRRPRSASTCTGGRFVARAQDQIGQAVDHPLVLGPLVAGRRAVLGVGRQRRRQAACHRAAASSRSGWPSRPGRGTSAPPVPDRRAPAAAPPPTASARSTARRAASRSCGTVLPAARASSRGLHLAAWPVREQRPTTSASITGVRPARSTRPPARARVAGSCSTRVTDSRQQLRSPPREDRPNVAITSSTAHSLTSVSAAGRAARDAAAAAPTSSSGRSSTAAGRCAANAANARACTAACRPCSRRPSPPPDDRRRPPAARPRSRRHLQPDIAGLLGRSRLGRVARAAGPSARRRPSAGARSARRSAGRSQPGVADRCSTTDSPPRARRHRPVRTYVRS